MEAAVNQIANVDQVSLDYFAEGHDQKYSWLVLKADVQNLQLFDNFAHGILILHVLEHIPDLEKAMAELKRVLHPCGWLLVEVPCSFDDESRSHTVDCRDFTSDRERSDCSGQRDHVWKLNCEDFKRSLSSAGFKTALMLLNTGDLPEDVLGAFKFDGHP